MSKKSEEKILDEVTTALIYGYLGGVGVCFENIQQKVFVYIV